MHQRLVAWLFILLRLALSLVFLGAALSKMTDIGGFIEEVAKYQLLPRSFIPLFSLSLLIIELVAGILFALGIRVRFVASVLVSLLLLFVAALSQALLRHLDLTCGCFGGSEPASWWTVIRDVVLLIATIPFLLHSIPVTDVIPGR